jgi:hypothetical protein
MPTHFCSCGVPLYDTSVHEILVELDKISDDKDLSHFDCLTWTIPEGIPYLYYKDLTYIDKDLSYIDEHVLQCVMSLFIGTYKNLGIENVTRENSDILEWTKLDETMKTLSWYGKAGHLYIGPEGKEEKGMGNTSTLCEILEKVVKIIGILGESGVRPSKIYHIVEKMYMDNLE